MRYSKTICSLSKKCSSKFFNNNFKCNYSHSSALEIQKNRVDIFEKEAKRQSSLITDIEKIKVNFEGKPENCTLVMNKGLSTPNDCCLHVSRMVLDQSVLAEVDGEMWDMGRPLISDCTLRLRHFKEADPYFVNKAFWRTLSLMLGAVIENSFKDSFQVQAIAPIPPKVRHGCFAYDFTMNTESWSPTQDELRIFSTEMIKLALAKVPIQRLPVSPKLALKMFEDNPYKSNLIENITAENSSGEDIILYRIGNFIDINRGPLVGHTGHMGKCTIAAIHSVGDKSSPLYRAQGVALPKNFQLNYYAYSILIENAKNLNVTNLPQDNLKETRSRERSTS